MVEYAGHPLVGRVLPVVRRYGQRRERQWVIALPDGSRQYIPASWCSPLSSAEGILPVPAPPPEEEPPDAASPLSLAALRDLAALVRRLQEKAAQRGEEQRDDDRGEQSRASGSREQPGDIEWDAGAAKLGELCGGGSATPGAGDPASGTPAAAEEVRQS